MYTERVCITRRNFRRETTCIRKTETDWIDSGKAVGTSAGSGKDSELFIGVFLTEFFCLDNFI